MAARDPDGLLRAFFWARLGVAVLLLALFPLLPANVTPGTTSHVFRLTLLGIVVSSVALLLAPLPQPRRVLWLVFLLDTVLVTALVAVTDGARSIFTFLYVLSVVSACVMLSRTGGLVIAAVASLLYTGLVLGASVFPVAAYLDVPGSATGHEILAMFLNSGMFLVVAIVAGDLAERFQVARREIETQRRDLRDLQAFRDLIFQSVGAGLVAVDDRRTITAFNRAAEDITGRPVRQAIGRTWASVFGPAVALDAVQRSLGAQPRGSVRHEAAVERPDGTAVPARLTFSTLRSGDGAPLGLIVVVEDLSAIRALEARMRQADRLATLGRMAANIAHEIRNPLASLTGAIEALTGTLSDGTSRERLTRIVLQESERLNGIIRDFLAYARPAPLAVRSVNVAEVLDEVLVLLEHGAEPARHKLVREFAPALAWPVDPQQFRQAVWNLCLNALQAMPDGGELRVGATIDRQQLEVRVADTGEGIPPGALSHIFEPFYSTKTSGSGLGLALVHRIVQDHGGDIDVRSAPGFGTTVTLTLPRAHA